MIHVYYSVCKGKEKNVCDDTALIGGRCVNEESGEMVLETPGFVCLCDGVGGNAGGKEASVFICQKIAGLEMPETAEALADELAGLNAELLQYAKTVPGKNQMATTLTGLCISENGIFLMQAGNTRLYAYRGGYLQQITEDQTTSQWLRSIGQGEAAESCNQSEIRCAFGGGRADYLKFLAVEQVFERRMPSALLFTTDGVHDTLSEDEMEEILGKDGGFLEKAKALTDRALEKGTLDDRTAMLVRVEKE